MERQKRWQLAVIVAVLVLTIYNILPTIIYYSKPLRQQVTLQDAKNIQHDIAERVNQLEQDSINWVYSFCNGLQIKPQKVELRPEDPSIIEVSLSNEKEADLFRKFLPQAGLEIPFVPAQMGMIENQHRMTQSPTVQVIRRIGTRLDDTATLFNFSDKVDQNGKITPFYFELVSDRFQEITRYVSGGAAEAHDLNAILTKTEERQAAIFQLAEKILFIADNFGENNPLVKRYFSTLFSYQRGTAAADYTRLLAQFQDEKKQIEQKRHEFEQEQKKKEFADSRQAEYLNYLKNQVAILDRTVQVLTHHQEELIAPVAAISENDVQNFLKTEHAKNPSQDGVYAFSIGAHHPLFNQLLIDWKNDCIQLRLHPEVLAIRTGVATSEVETRLQEKLNRWILNEVARLSHDTDESFTVDAADFRINLYQLPSSKSFLALDLSKLAANYAAQTLQQIKQFWKPQHSELASLPLFSVQEFKDATGPNKKLCIVTAGGASGEGVLEGLRPRSIYVVMRGLKNLLDQYARFPDSVESKQFSQEFEGIAELLQKRGFIGYAGSMLSKELRNDYVFELDDYYSMLLKATREEFAVHGSKKFAMLEFSDVEQRILTQNRIDDAIQEDLLRWKESYQAASVDLNTLAHYTVPKPTQSAFYSNILLACKKYFRGDDSKILRWGLDLSGGKSVRIGLVDNVGRQVEDPVELKEAANELYTRINKMGVSERTIRIENSSILLDFPGSQGLSATELVKASAMYFHVVNEQFGAFNKAINKDVHEFLQEVWNEAVVTNRQDIESINEIASAKLAAAAEQGALLGPKSAAQILYEKGLRLANQRENRATAAFDESISTIARYRGDDMGEWGHQTHPLLIVFKNYALEGASLENVQTSYDPVKGNTLLFNVSSSYAKGNGGNPCDDFYTWTAQFSEEGITGTPREAYTQGRGYRMAVILNGSVISAPTLSSPLRDHAMITGNFSSREVAKLATDLKAGSLSFTPKILSELNVSPELGVQERQQGIMAAGIAIVCVIITMCGYYRFAGIIASIAVLINVLIIWAVMQNMDAVLTLPGIAGMVLTVGMAVDANVLVFERIREEFKISGRIAQAITAGYQKAFSAIFDSNITTILAALILLQFDCGPIRGFAMTLIIGISSSMFTALFMTRYFFAGWLQNPKNTELKMSEWIHGNNFNFLKMTKPAVIISVVLLVVGSMFFVNNFRSMIGMDFTGGYSLVVEMENKEGSRLSEKVTDALRAKNMRAQEFQVRELGRPDHLRIQLGLSLEDPGHAFHGLPLVQDAKGIFEYQKNPRINYIVNALASKGLTIKPTQLEVLQHNWTTMSGGFSDAMRNNALIALGLSLIGILIYIAFRFEWKYAVSSVLALVHDVALTLAVMALASSFGLPVQLNLETIGAIMTIIGYSLNDTIIVFDRIREDIGLLRKKTFAEIINCSLNQTLSRTLMTSGTTLLVLLALDFFAGSSIFGFAFVMTVGVFLGTLSSLFIASPILLWLHNKEEVGRVGESTSLRV